MINFSALFLAFTAVLGCFASQMIRFCSRLIRKWLDVFLYNRIRLSTQELSQKVHTASYDISPRIQSRICNMILELVPRILIGLSNADRLSSWKFCKKISAQLFELSSAHTHHKSTVNVAYSLLSGKTSIAAVAATSSSTHHLRCPSALPPPTPPGVGSAEDMKEWWPYGWTYAHHRHAGVFSFTSRPSHRAHSSCSRLSKLTHFETWIIQ